MSNQLRRLQATTFVSTLDRFAMPPMLVAIAHDLDAPLSEVVQAAGAYFLVYGLCQPFWGMVSDRLGRVRTMRLTLLVAGLLALMSAGAWSPLSLAVARGLAGGFFGAAYPSTLIYVGDTVAIAERQRAIAGLMVGVATGTALASLGAGLLADLASWRVAFLITGTASVALAWTLHRLPEPDATMRPGSAREAVGTLARSPVALLVLLFAFVEGAVLLGGLTLLPPAVENAGATAAVAGAVTAVYGIAVFLGARLVGRLAATWHPSRLIALGASAAVLGCGLLAVSQEPPMAIAVALLLGLAWTSMHSSLQTWATELLPAARATVISFFAGSLFVGNALAAVVVGGLADAGRYSLIYAAYATLAIPLGLAAGWQRHRWHRTPVAAA
ncbi:MFS transporter [Nocardioides marmotae]|uniref:MFS transporter n=1 Tax=Nocardioides marmotae TaxID=2663857 RepID=A0A6I3JFI0_9ACTN|nr:MFS transporter [Nocardioides marmotae]MCR6033091.1 MFS transporter [Gordonia jinghuaiqii]MBC9732591.1 MFS transporter [Nocardioides marmotae]MTB83710.1 MFS transporter [Nocardioides marmotae]MTB96743.1 MFS transporter [Nocardioides marmotae]QKE03048.1 MFS transporter [Nocardioides marmotae]